MISREELKDFELYLNKSFPSWSAGTSLSMSVYLDLMFKCPTFSVQLIRILQLFYGLVLRLSKAKLRIKKIDIEISSILCVCNSGRSNFLGLFTGLFETNTSQNYLIVTRSNEHLNYDEEKVLRVHEIQLNGVVCWCLKILKLAPVMFYRLLVYRPISYKYLLVKVYYFFNFLVFI